jgi:hypothetical protein
VRSAVIGHDVRHLKRRVELEPVRTGRPEPVEVADVDGRNAWIVVADVTVEAGNAEIGAGCWHTVYREVIQRVEVDAVIADAKIVVQIGPQRVRVRKQRVLVHARLRDHLDGNRCRRISDIAGVAVVPVVAKIQPGFVAEVLIDAGEDLVDVVVECGVGPQIGRRPRQV